jgi:protein-disulfide isomerase
MLMRKLFLIAVAAFACKTPPPAPTYAPPPKAGEDPVVLTIGGDEVRQSEIDKKLGGRLQTAITEHNQAVYDMRLNAIENIVAEKLFDAEARKRGVARDQLIAEEVENKVPPPPEAELKAFYEKYKDQIAQSARGPGGASYEAVKERIGMILSQDKRQDRFRAYMGELKKAAGVQITLALPDLPRVQVDAKGPMKGSASARVTIVEFSDFQCPFCSRVVRTVDEVLKKYGDDVKLYFRHYPLPSHENAPKAAEASMCAHEQHKFWEMHDKLFDNQRALEAPQLKVYARELGLDAKEFERCLDGGKYAELVRQDQSAGEAAGVNGTPAFFINGVPLSGAQPLEAFEQVIERELKGEG